MATPTYRIRGSQVERENVPQEWMERVRPELGVQVEQPSLQALRSVAAYDPSEEYDPSILEDAKRTLEETYATQAQLRPRTTISAAKPEGWFSRATRGVGNALNLPEKGLKEAPYGQMRYGNVPPLAQALLTPAGGFMTGPIGAARQSARYATQYGPAMARAFGPRSAQTISHTASPRSAGLEGLRTAARPDKYTRTVRSLGQDVMEETPGIGNPLARELGEQLPVPEGADDILSRYALARRLGLGRILAGTE